MSLRRVRIIAFGALAGAVAVPASAQMDPVMLGQGLVMSTAIRAQAERDAARLRRHGRLPTVSPTAANTRFVPSLARRKAQEVRFLAAAGRVSPEIVKSLAPAFRGDPVRHVAPFLRARIGARVDDVADLTAVYLVSAWYVVHGRTGDPTRAEFAAVRDQLRRAYAASPGLRDASNAAKQDAGEGSLYLALLDDVLVETMRAHTEAKARLTAEIAAGAKSTFGLDLRAMRITKAGLVG